MAKYMETLVTVTMWVKMPISDADAAMFEIMTEDQRCDMQKLQIEQDMESSATPGSEHDFDADVQYNRIITE